MIKGDADCVGGVCVCAPSCVLTCNHHTHNGVCVGTSFGVVCRHAGDKTHQALVQSNSAVEDAWWCCHSLHAHGTGLVNRVGFADVCILLYDTTCMSSMSPASSAQACQCDSYVTTMFYSLAWPCSIHIALGSHCPWVDRLLSAPQHPRWCLFVDS